MANKNFIVQNGLQVGGLTIFAGNSGISTAGNIVTSGNIIIQSGSGGGPGGTYSMQEDFGSGGDWAQGDVKTDASANNIIKAVVSGSWSANAIAAFAGMSASSTGVMVSIEGSYSAAGTISNVQYFSGNTTYVLTFTSSANQGLTNWNVAGIDVTNPSSGGGTSLIIGSTGTSTSNVVTGGLQAVAIGNVTPGTGVFTTGTFNTATTGGLQAVAIGNATPGTAAFTTLSASGVVSVTNATETTSTTTGALVVSGGAAIAGNAYVANNLYIGSTSFGKSLTTPTIIAVDNGSNYAQIAMINSSGNGSADFAAYADNGTDAAGWVDVGIAGSTFSDSNYGITKPHDGYLITKPLNNTYGGNLVIGTSELGTTKDIVIGVGGFSTSSEVARFHGNVSTNGTFTVKYPTVSTSTTSGALVVTGGAGIGGDVYVGGNIYASSLNTVSSSQLSVTAPLVYLTGQPYPYTYDIGLYSHFIGGPANVYTHTGVVRSYQNGYYGFFSNVKTEPAGSVTWTDPGLIWDTVKAGALVLANATAATSTTSGALQVAGGAGIAGAVYVGGNGTNSIVHTGHIIPSSNVTYNLGSSTAWYGTYYGIATQAKYADLAENYQADDNYAPGQVLMFGGDEEVTIAEANTIRVAGVVSTNPAHLMNGQLKGNKVVAIALQGRVPCNVIGPVRKGDLMISAGFGYAKSHNTPNVGQVIGKALENFTGSKGVIEVVVGRV